MKTLKIKLGLFSLLAILAVSVFLTSCEQDTITKPTDVISAQEMLVAENVTDIDEQIRISGEMNKDCVKKYFVPFDNKITNAEQARNHLANLSDEEKAKYLLTEEQIANRDPNDYCDDWDVYCEPFVSDCYFTTCFKMPAYKSIFRECAWGFESHFYCWFDCN